MQTNSTTQKLYKALSKTAQGTNHSEARRKAGKRKEWTRNDYKRDLGAVL